MAAEWMTPGNAIQGGATVLLTLAVRWWGQRMIAREEVLNSQLREREQKLLDEVNRLQQLRVEEAKSQAQAMLDFAQQIREMIDRDAR